MWSRLSSWLKPPVFAQDEEKTHTARLLHSILFALLGVSTLYVLLSPVVSLSRLFLMISPLLVLLAVLFLLLRRGFVRLTGLALVWGLWCILIYSSYLNGGVRAPGYGGLIVVLMLAAFLVGARLGMVLAGLSIAAGALLIALEARGWLPASEAPNISVVLLITQVTYFIVSAVLLVLVTRSIREALGRASLSEERYRLIASIMSDYAFSNRYGPQGEVVDQWLGGAFETITGYSPREYFAQGGWLSILHPEDWEQDARDMALLHANQQAVTEVRILRKDGAVRWVRVYGHPVWDAQEQRLVGMYGAVQDITARKLMELDLRRRADEMTLLYQISLALTSGQDLYHALRAFVKELKRVMTVDAFHIGLYDPQTDLFSYTLFLNLEQDLQVPPRKLGESPGLTWEVISTRRTLYLPNIQDPEIRRAHQIVMIVPAEVHSYVGIPLIVQEQVLGVMSVQAMQADAYSPDQLRMLETLAAQVANTIEKASLFEQVQSELDERKRVEAELRQREAILETVTFAAEQFLKTSDWRLNINFVLARLGKTLDVTHVYLFEHFVGADGMEYSSLTYEWTAPGYPSDFSVAFYQTPHPVRADEPGGDRLLRQGQLYLKSLSSMSEGERARLQGLGVKTILEAPLFVGGQWWGTFGFDDFVHERTWTNAELDALKLAAGILSAAIERQKTESAVRESERIYRQAIESAGAVPYYRDYREERYAFIGAQIEAIIGYKPEEMTMQLWEKIMLENIPLGEGAGLPIDDAVVHARTGKLKVWKSDMRVLARNGEERWITDSAVELFDGNEFSYASVGILQDVTDRKRTEANLRKRESVLEAIIFAAEQFLKSSEWREKINAVLERLGGELNASHAYLFERHRGADDKLVSSMTYEWTAPDCRTDLGTPDFQNLPMQSMGFERFYAILDSGEPLVASTSFFTTEEWEYMQSRNIKALLEMRVLVNGEHWGTIGFDDVLRTREWSPLEVDVLRVAANVLGAAIQRQAAEMALQVELDERKKLIEELKARNAESETLRESVAIVASTLEQTEAIDRILEQLARVVPYDSASVQLLHGDTLEIVRVRGYDDPDKHIGLRFEIHEREPSYPALRENAPYMLFKDVQVSTAVFTDEPHSMIHAWLAIPLRVKGQVIGIIALDGKRPGQFSEQDALLAVTYANQVAIALENARLFSELQEELSERQKLIGELENKNSELERFTYTVSHDLKSPLVTINGFLGYLEQDAISGNEERFKRDLQRISEAVRKMQNLLNELLELSRIGRVVNTSQHVPFTELARDAVALVSGRLDARRVVVEVPPDLPSVYVDRPRVVEVLQNLLDNAAKYMGDQLHPRIELGQRADEQGFAVFYVQDNGIGIAPEFHERIFGLFNKLDPRSEGTGVGLALVRRIIEIHGGRIWVESSLGAGTTFCFSLPKGNLTQ